MPKVTVCATCNHSFALDEEYLSALLASVLSGNTEPAPIQFSVAAGALSHSPGLRKRIEQARRLQGTLWGEPELRWEAEIDRVNRVVVKNARGHALYELNEAVMGPPSSVICCPLVSLTPDQRHAFEEIPQEAVWPEVGSRMMQRVAGVAPLVNGWVDVQESVYRYAIGWPGGEVIVKTVLREYLATEVIWSAD